MNILVLLNVYPMKWRDIYPIYLQFDSLKAFPRSIGFVRRRV